MSHAPKSIAAGPCVAGPPCSVRSRPVSPGPPRFSAAIPPLFPGYSALLPANSGQKIAAKRRPRPAQSRNTLQASSPRQRLAGAQTYCAGDQPKPHPHDVAFGDILLAVHSLFSVRKKVLADRPSLPQRKEKFARKPPLFPGYFGLWWGKSGENFRALPPSVPPQKSPPASQAGGLGVV